MTGRTRGIQSIDISGRILRALVEGDAPMMLKELAQAADLAPAQCHAYLTSLRNVGMVFQDPESGRYAMGPFAMRLGIGWLRGTPLVAAAIRVLGLVTRETGVMSQVVVWGQGGPTIVHIHEGATPHALNLRQGTLYSVTGTASGRVFAAFGAGAGIAARIAAELDDIGGLGLLGQGLPRPAFEAECAATRARGHAIAREMPIPGINAVSAPVMDRQGALALAVTLIGTAASLPVTPGAPIIHRLEAAVAEITAQPPEPKP